MEVKIETDSNDAMEIKTEADSNDITECSQNVGPSIGTFAISLFKSSENGIHSFILKPSRNSQNSEALYCVMHSDMVIC